MEEPKFNGIAIHTTTHRTQLLSPLTTLMIITPGQFAPFMYRRKRTLPSYDHSRPITGVCIFSLQLKILPKSCTSQQKYMYKKGSTALALPLLRINHTTRKKEQLPKINPKPAVCILILTVYINFKSSTHQQNHSKKLICCMCCKFFSPPFPFRAVSI